MTAVENRYDRQERIQGWKQDALDEAKISVVGGGPIANFLSAVGAGLGFGSIWTFDNKIVDPSYHENFLFPLSEEKSQFRNKRLEEMIKKINPGIKAKGITWKFCRSYFTDIIGHPHSIVLTTNNPKTELVVSEYGLYHGIPVINGSASEFNAELTVLQDTGVVKKKLDEVKQDEHFSFDDIRRCIPRTFLSDGPYHEARQGVVTSSLVGGLIADEARKTVFRLFEGEELLDKEIYYNLLARDRISKANDYAPEDAKFDRNKTVHVIGAGSLGNAVALLLALEGIKNILIIDDDEVETVNLNRQILFYNKVGEPKATALAENLKIINPDINVEGVFGRLEPDSKYDSKPDLVMDCVDSFKSRAIIDAYAKNNNVPVISGGTSFDAGQVLVWKPGQTACLYHALNIEEQLKIIAEEERQSCVRAPDPSVIISNWIVGSLMVGELYSVFGNIPSISGKIRYNANVKNRISVVPEPPCGC